MIYSFVHYLGGDYDFFEHCPQPVISWEMDLIPKSVAAAANVVASIFWMMVGPRGVDGSVVPGTW